MKLLKLSLLWLALLFSAPAFAQTPVTTQPYATTSYNASGTIGSTGVFQQLFPASTSVRGRVACEIQNNGGHSMYVYFGPIANATTASSLTLAANGLPMNLCNNGGVVLQDQVSITGTGSDIFYANQQ